MSDNRLSDEPTLTLDYFEPGTRLGQYEIRKLLGSGSMGMVYLSRDTTLDRLVAVKLLRRELMPAKDRQRQFMNEARVLAKLNHPNIVTLFSVEEFDGVPFMTMEYVDGLPLHVFQRTHEATMESRLELALQICESLSCAHENSVIHRDLKPSNVLVTEQGRVKVVDFGLAQLLSFKRAGTSRSIQGTIHYMSPEQIRSLKPDERSDLFTFGTMLYELFSGQLPFSADTIGDTLQEIIEREPTPLCEISNAIPLDLQKIIAKLLEKSPDDRYQRADDLLIDLRYSLEAVLAGRAKYAGRTFGGAASIAVLPFSNLGGKEDERYFCDGITEEITNALSQINGLQVVPRTTTLSFRDSTQDIKAIGRKLHVDTILEGAVRKLNDRLRVTARLADVTTGYSLWSTKFDRKIDDVFEIQDDVANSVAQALTTMLGGEEVKPERFANTTDLTAYDYYLKGRYYYHQGRRKSYHYALEMYRRAVEIDANFALAFVGIAETVSILNHLYGRSSKEELHEADTASLSALRIDPTLPQALSVRGFTLWLQGNLTDAKRFFQRAMAGNPNLADAPYLYGRALFQAGEFEKALEMFEIAGKRQEHHEARYFAAQTLTALGRDKEASTMYRMALRSTERHIEINPDDARSYTIGAVSLCRSNDDKAGLRWAERALQIDPEDPGIQYNVACLYALAGETEKALECLEYAVQEGFAHREWVENDPDLISLRENPRFLALPWRS